MIDVTKKYILNILSQIVLAIFAKSLINRYCKSNEKLPKMHILLVLRRENSFNISCYSRFFKMEFKFFFFSTYLKNNTYKYLVVMYRKILIIKNNDFKNSFTIFVAPGGAARCMYPFKVAVSLGKTVTSLAVCYIIPFSLYLLL
jgi:hypothetical protein